MNTSDVTRVIYKDKNNNIIREEEANGYWYECTYNSKNEPLRHEDSKGVWYEYTYNKRGLKASYRDCSGNSEEYIYHFNNVLAKQTTVCKEYTETFTYDDRGREISYESSKGTFWTSRYDSQGNKQFYDRNGRLIKTISVEALNYDEYY